MVGKGLRVVSQGRGFRLAAVEADDPLWNEQEHFLSRLRERSVRPVVDLSQAVDGLKLADAMIESLRLGHEVCCPN